MLCGYLDYLNTKRIILGSKSGPRKALVTSSGLTNFEVMDSGFEEDLEKEAFETQTDYVRATSAGKVDALKAALDAKNEDFDVLICCDTVCVSKDGNIIEKPKSIEEQRENIRTFSGSYHTVVTWLNVLVRKDGNEERFEHEETTKIYFHEIPEKSIEAYPLLYPETLIAAGGYRIQSCGGTLISKIEGDYSNVVGLPLSHLCKIIVKAIEGGKL